MARRNGSAKEETTKNDNMISVWMCGFSYPLSSLITVVRLMVRSQIIRSCARAHCFSTRNCPVTSAFKHFGTLQVPMLNAVPPLLSAMNVQPCGQLFQNWLLSIYDATRLRASSFQLVVVVLKMIYVFNL